MASDDKMKNAEALIREGRLFVTNNDYSHAFDRFKRAAELLSSPVYHEKRRWALAAAAYAAILDKKIPEGLKLLANAIVSGYTDLEKMDSLAQVKYQGKRLGNLRSFEQLYAKIRRNAQPVCVIEFISQQLETWEWMHFSHGSDLKELRRHIPRFDAKKEWSLFLACLDWVHRRFAHDAVNRASLLNPRIILREAKRSKRFTCQEYAVLLSAVLQAHGHPARVIALLKNGYNYGSGKGHWVTEVWSDHLDKWILFDPQNNCYWKQGATLLNASHIRELLLAKKINCIKAFTGGREKRAMREWLDHFHAIWYYQNQNYFKQWRTDGKMEELSYIPALLFQDKARQRFVHHGEPGHLYPKMNRLNFECGLVNRQLDFRLRHSFPFFAWYECAGNGSSWKQCHSRVKIPVKPGKNRVYFRVRDLFGRASVPVGMCIKVTHGSTILQRNMQ